MDDREHRHECSEPPPLTAEAPDPREVARQVLAHHRLAARRVVQAAASFREQQLAERAAVVRAWLDS